MLKCKFTSKVKIILTYIVTLAVGLFFCSLHKRWVFNPIRTLIYISYFRIPIFLYITILRREIWTNIDNLASFFKFSTGNLRFLVNLIGKHYVLVDVDIFHVNY